MSDFVHTGHSPRVSADGTTIDSKLVFGACYALFLFRAVASRLLLRREHDAVFDRSQSIFAEARSAARVVVVSSFMGL